MHLLTPFADWILTVGVRASWLTLAVLTVRALARNQIPAHWRYALWIPVLQVLLTPSFLVSQWSLGSILSKTSIPLPLGPERLVSLPDRQWILHVWLAVAAGMGLLGICAFAHALWRFRRSRVPVNASLTDKITALANELGLKRTPQVWMASEIRSPAVTGLFKPILLLPSNFEENLTPEEMRFVLRHELMHIKRGDLPLNALLWVLLSLHWFNPMLWLAYFKARLDREVACDAPVLEHEPPSERVAYGHTLLKMENTFSHGLLGLGFVGIFQRGYALRSRISSIANPPKPKLFLEIGLGFGIPLLTFFGITKAESKSGPLDGVWINTDMGLRTIPKVEIKGNQIVYWTMIHTQDSKYGPFTLTLSGDSVDDNSPNKYGFLNEDAGSADNVMMIKRVGEKLVIDGVKAFKDGSGRANYHLSLTFTKQT
jgi:beta-lactamase regulating signal transducer with metallopeptidase domain